MRLFIAEKPSLGRAIAASLGVVKNEKGYITCENGDVVTWCIGHLLELAEPEAYDEKYKSWSLDTLPIFPKEWILIPTDPSKEQLDVVLKQIKKPPFLSMQATPIEKGIYWSMKSSNTLTYPMTLKRMHYVSLSTI